MAWAIIEIILYIIKQTVVYPARLRKLFIRPRSGKSWSQKSYLSGKSWSQKSYLSDPGGRKVGLRIVVYLARVREKLV